MSKRELCQAGPLPVKKHGGPLVKA